MAHINIHEKNSSLRFVDVGELPNRMLAPIEGYEKAPLVTLEEAVQPLLNIVPKVDRMVHVVKHKCHEPKDGLTCDESASIMLYTYESASHEDSLHVKLNETLRSEERESLIPWFLYLRLILTALARLPSKRCCAFRGVRENLWTNYSVGKVFVWWGFSSCASSIELLDNEHFFGKTESRTLFQIECKTAKDIRNHSFTAGDDELLLLPARQLQVTSCLDSGNGLHIIELKELKPQFDLLELVPLQKPSIKHKKRTKGQHQSIAVTKTVSAKSIVGNGKQNVPTMQLSTNTKPPVTPYIPSNAQWIKNAVTVAGGHGWGDATNQLKFPLGLIIDDSRTMFIADCDNDRIIQWNLGDRKGHVVAGGIGEGNQLDQLNGPTDVLIDKETNSLIICDRGNRRVLRWSLRMGTTRGQILLDNVDCYGLAMDEQRFLYISDDEKHEVRRYELGDKNGTLVAGGQDAGDGLDQLNEPTYLFVDHQQTIYVSDNENHRVMKWYAGASEGIIVAGGHGQGNALRQLSYPEGLFVDSLGTVYVADFGNDRVIRWTEGAQEGIVVAGHNDVEGEPRQFNSPYGLSFNRDGHLYVVDWNNHRVQQFSLECIENDN